MLIVIIAISSFCLLLSSGLVNVHRLEYLSPQLRPRRNLTILEQNKVPKIERGLFERKTYVEVRLIVSYYIVIMYTTIPYTPIEEIFFLTIWSICKSWCDYILYTGI